MVDPECIPGTLGWGGNTCWTEYQSIAGLCSHMFSHGGDLSSLIHWLEYFGRWKESREPGRKLTWTWTEHAKLHTDRNLSWGSNVECGTLHSSLAVLVGELWQVPHRRKKVLNSELRTIIYKKEKLFKKRLNWRVVEKQFDGIGNLIHWVFFLFFPFFPRWINGRKYLG